ncbi:DUF5605 domain-containing protein [Streptomyces sp. NPDC005009]
MFPKHYDFTVEEPPRHPFLPGEGEGWDTTRFDVEFFRHLERRVQDLAELEIQADVILFHPYDRWGFQDLGAAADDRYVCYVVRRLAGLANVWWSLANEYDLMTAKRDADRCRIGELVAAEDHTRHLLSVHNGPRIYDFSAPWITHCSIQKTDFWSPAGQVEGWRERWNKPVVVDELGYEGDVPQEWGSLAGAELVHRFWQITVRGAYATHGETYVNAEQRLWWATGGRLDGSAPERLAFLRRLVEECPDRRLEPLPGYSHVKGAGVPGRYELHYLDVYQPRSLSFTWPEGVRAAVDVIDPWEMTIRTLPDRYTGRFTIDLPGRPRLVLRLRSVPDS